MENEMSNGDVLRKEAALVVETEVVNFAEVLRNIAMDSAARIQESDFKDVNLSAKPFLERINDVIDDFPAEEKDVEFLGELSELLTRHGLKGTMMDKPSDKAKSLYSLYKHISWQDKQVNESTRQNRYKGYLALKEYQNTKVANATLLFLDANPDFFKNFCVQAFYRMSGNKEVKERLLLTESVAVKKPTRKDRVSAKGIIEDFRDSDFTSHNQGDRDFAIPNEVTTICVLMFLLAFPRTGARIFEIRVIKDLFYN